jgi:hypothetical protein
MSGRCECLEQKHPEVGHEVAGDTVVRVVEQNSHVCRLPVRIHNPVNVDSVNPLLVKNRNSSHNGFVIGFGRQSGSMQSLFRTPENPQWRLTESTERGFLNPSGRQRRTLVLGPTCPVSANRKSGVYYLCFRREDGPFVLLYRLPGNLTLD